MFGTAKYFFFIILFCGVLKAQVNENLLDAGIKNIYRIKFDSAQIQFDEFIRLNPNSPEGYFFQAMLEWWKINLDKNIETYDENFYSKVNKTVEICDNILDKNENDFRATLFKGGALGYRGLLKSVRDSWMKAAEDGKEALNLLRKAAEMQPNNKDALLGIGIYNFFAEYVPEKYPFILPLMLLFPRGDKVKGLMQIKEIAENSRYAKIEANYILAYLYLNYEINFKEAEVYSQKLFFEFPENPLFERYLYTSYVGLNNLIDAIDGWKKVIEKGRNKQAGYDNIRLQRDANFYISSSLFNLKRISEAGEYLKECERLNSEIDKNNESTFTANTYLLYAEYYKSAGDTYKTIYYCDRVLSMKDFETHKQAEMIKKSVNK